MQIFLSAEKKPCEWLRQLCPQIILLDIWCRVCTWCACTVNLRAPGSQVRCWLSPFIFHYCRGLIPPGELSFISKHTRFTTKNSLNIFFKNGSICVLTENTSASIFNPHTPCQGPCFLLGYFPYELPLNHHQHQQADSYVQYLTSITLHAEQDRCRGLMNSACWWRYWKAAR